MSDFDFNSLAIRLAKQKREKINCRVEALKIVASCCDLATCIDLQENLGSLLLDVLSFGGECNLRFFENYPILGAVWLSQSDSRAVQAYEVVSFAKKLADKFLRNDEHASPRLKLIDSSCVYTGLIKTILLFCSLNRIDLIDAMQKELNQRNQSYAIGSLEPPQCSSCGELVKDDKCTSPYCGDDPSRYLSIN